MLNVAGNINAGTNSITLYNDSTAIATMADAITQSAGTITQTSNTKSITLGVKSGKITQTGGNIVSAGTVKLTNRLGTIGAITLNQNSNNFNSITAVNFANDLLGGLTVKDSNGLNIGLLNLSGPLAVTTNTTTTNTGLL